MKKIVLENRKNNGRNITVSIKGSKILTNSHGFVQLPHTFENIDTISVDNLYDKFIVPQELQV